ncbi:MAG: acyltransferase domain-containing protein, partial [Acidobacteria bacterium]|nr:acyltransferase domain-containing protein [Acidobacteriota bacterium]
VVARSVGDAAAALAGDDPRRRLSAWCESGEREIAFLFPGLGGQYAGMGRGLYDAEPTFRGAVDRCAEILEPILGEDLRTILFEGGEPAAGEASQAKAPVDLKAMLRRGKMAAEGPLQQTRYAHPALFVIQYALARLWQSWGLAPSVLLGYSLGEYVAAVLGGTLELADALELVARRAQLIEELPAGGMIAVALPEDEAAALAAAVSPELAVSAVNGPEQTVVAGPAAAVTALEERMAADGVAGRRLQAGHAFHSPMMRPVAAAIEELVAGFELKPPRRPWISNVTGAEVRAEDAVDPAYWARHTVSPVRFARGIETLLAEPGRLLVELGPGQTLASLVLQHPAAAAASPTVLSALRHDYEREDDVAFALGALGKAWLAGARPEWPKVHGGERRRRLVLPTYPFERKRYWIVTSDVAQAPAESIEVGALAVPGWRRTEPLPANPRMAAARTRWWLLCGDLPGGDGLGDDGFADEVAARLVDRGATVERVAADEAPGRLVDLAAADRPAAILDLASAGLGLEGCGRLEALAAALAGEASPRTELWLAGSGLFDVVGGEVLDAGAGALAGALGPLAVHHGFAAAVVDVDPGAAGSPQRRRAVAQLVSELGSELASEPGSEPAGGPSAPGRAVAFRGPHRWRPAAEPAAEPAAAAESLAGAGFHLLFDGLGDPGHAFAEALTDTGAALVLVEPAGFPDREEWAGWLDSDASGSLLAERIRRAQALEESGAVVRIVGPERTDADAVAVVVARAREDFGDLGCVVYAPTAPVEESGAAGLDHLHRVALGLDALETSTAEARAALLVADAAVAPSDAGAGAAAAAAWSELL